MIEKEKEKKDLGSLTSEDVKDLIMSIRLYLNRLNFVISDSQSEQMIYKGNIELAENTSYLNSIANAFSDNPFLKLHFSKTIVYINPSKWCIIPAELYHSEKAYLWIRSITEYNEDTQKAFVVSFKMPEDGKVFVFDCDKDIIDILNKTLCNIVLKPYIVEVVEYIRRLKANAHNKISCISINKTTIDFIELKNGVISKSCNFTFTNIQLPDSIIDEVIYFIASINNNSHFDIRDDFMYIFYNKDVSPEIDIESLKYRLSGYSYNIILHNTNL